MVESHFILFNLLRSLQTLSTFTISWNPHNTTVHWLSLKIFFFGSPDAKCDKSSKWAFCIVLNPTFCTNYYLKSMCLYFNVCFCVTRSDFIVVKRIYEWNTFRVTCMEMALVHTTTQGKRLVVWAIIFSLVLFCYIKEK